MQMRDLKGNCITTYSIIDLKLPLALVLQRREEGAHVFFVTRKPLADDPSPEP